MILAYIAGIVSGFPLGILITALINVMNSKEENKWVK